ncbi:MurR/RpiR family transcriptional regulator [Achromobacter pestifer]|uniref:HTH rpiR-type domain-containing protein n=1 Tax=Achromobacter pestifer TaxID=1353889 RepID=A0A6S6ZIP5_9BURK|nr:MurR/RpiR family transcriptional regulator [Achromobacter pestifer]CAB3682229.1 hypothetical protein LMG3431_04422 [Achromobacter pestifer]
MTTAFQDQLRELAADLPAELQRAASWVLANPAEVALWSMRRQAQAVGVAPATMLRMARAAGYDSYETFRAPFQRLLAGGSAASLRDRAARLQASREHRAGLQRHDALTDLQTAAIASVCEGNDDASFDAAAAALLAARQVGFLGLRSAFGIAHQMRYAYHLLRRNGILIDGLGGAPAEEADCLQAGDALVVISQAPYPAATLHLSRQIAQRGVTVLALTDSTTNPVALSARHVLHFTPPADTDPADLSGQRGPGSFFHSTAGLLGLAEHLIARVAAQGGGDVLQRLTEIESRLHADGVYWSDASTKRARQRP